MRVLLITSEGFDTPNSINHLLITLSEDILKDGHELSMVYSHRTGIYDDIPEQLKGYDALRTSIIKRKKINKNNFIFRYIEEVFFSIKAWREWRKFRKDIDVVILQSNPCSVYHAILLKLFLKKPIVFNLYDIFPGHARDIGVMRSKFIYEFFRLLQKPLYRSCDAIVAMSEDMKDKLAAEGIPTSKIKVINNWFDDEMFRVIPKHENKFFKKYDLDPQKFYIQFAGLLGYVFDYEFFIQTAKLLQDEKEIVFLLIGDGSQKDIVLSRIEELNVHNIKYFPWQPIETIADVYNACDIGFIPLKEGVIGNGIPSKACQLMAAHKVIVNSVEESDYVRLFRQKNMGVSITNRCPETAAKEILNLYGDPARKKTLEDNAFEFAYENFSRAKNTRLFIDLLKSFVNPDERDGEC
jgi:glycosyltransferase involved in cell wall biosynthesis